MDDTSVHKLVDDICRAIHLHRHFLITTHIRADGDGIGSAIALYHALVGMGKTICIANDSQTPQIYKFIVPSEGMYIHPQTPKDRPEVVFALDSPSRERLGKIQEIIPQDTVMINIDHHI